MKVWKILLVAGVTSLTGVACERVGGPANKADYQPQNNDTELPLGETQNRQFGESGTGGTGHTGAHNVNVPLEQQNAGTGGAADAGVPNTQPQAR